MLRDQAATEDVLQECFVSIRRPANTAPSRARR
nr:hypothetical protein [Achromobacter xylosoxidans]